MVSLIKSQEYCSHSMASEQIDTITPERKGTLPTVPRESS